jgi:hypothetical protein
LFHYSFNNRNACLPGIKQISAPVPQSAPPVVMIMRQRLAKRHENTQDAPS